MKPASRVPKWKSPGLWALIGALAAGVCLAAHLAMSYADDRIRDSGVATEGEVVGRSGFGRFRFYLIEHRYGGETFSGKVSCTGCYEIGQRITLYIDKDKPSRFVTDDGISSLAMWPGLAVGGTIWMSVIALVCAGRWWLQYGYKD